MRFDLGHFRTKLGQRIVMLFVLCALLPTMALGFMSYREAVSVVDRNSSEQMELGTSDAEMGVLDRIQSVESELILLASAPSVVRALNGAARDMVGEEQLRRLSALTLVTPGATIPIVGDLTDTPKLSPETLADLDAGESALAVVPDVKKLLFPYC